MAANASTKLQINFKLNDGTLINVYADNGADLETQLTALQDVTALITTTAQALVGVEAISQGARVVSIAPAAQTQNRQAPLAAEGPICKHGAMIHKSGTAKNGKPWKAWMCTAPKGQSCDPIWDRD